MPGEIIGTEVQLPQNRIQAQQQPSLYRALPRGSWNVQNEGCEPLVDQARPALLLRKQLDLHCHLEKVERMTGDVENVPGKPSISLACQVLALSAAKFTGQA